MTDFIFKVNLMSNKKNYYSLNDFAINKYGKKLYKLSLDGGFTCPNRDGSKGVGGCIFCDNEGSGHFAAEVCRDVNNLAQNSSDKCISAKNITVAIDEAKKRISRKLPADGNYGFIAYFQAYTGSYGPIDKLRELYYAAISDPEVMVLSIATRPDCLGPDVLDLLHELSAKIDVWVELGLQSSKESTIKMINRCYENDVYKKAVEDLSAAGVSHIVTHVIIGLPGETKEDILNTVKYVSDTYFSVNHKNVTDLSYNSNISFGIKLQLLHVLKGTVLADMYEQGLFKCLTLEEYAEILKMVLEILPKDIVVHRITGDGDKNKLIAPLWSADKKKVLNYLNKYLIS